MLLFKYVGPEAIKRVFERRGEVSIRFGLPKTYNDPYELFLTPDPPLTDDEHRAFYSFFLGKVVEAPVACFSKRPDSVVMWAHYGREGAGICLAFDEDMLLNQFPLAYVGDIVYSDSPAKVPSSAIVHAFTTGKRRHTFGLLAIGHRAAYFIKRIDWQYEAERRVVVTPDAIENRDGILIGRISTDCLRYVILGPHVEPSAREMCQEHLRNTGIPLADLRVGSRTFVPFFAGDGVGVREWNGDDFRSVESVCSQCGEPAELQESGNCEWCSIPEDVKRTAPLRSGLLLTLHYGIDKGIPLEFEGMPPKGHLFGEGDKRKL